MIKTEIEKGENCSKGDNFHNFEGPESIMDPIYTYYFL